MIPVMKTPILPSTVSWPSSEKYTLVRLAGSKGLGPFSTFMVPTVPLTRPGGDAPKQVNESRLNLKLLIRNGSPPTRCTLTINFEPGLSAMVPVRMRVSALAGGAAANDASKTAPTSGAANFFMWTPSMIRCDVHRSTRHDHLHRSTARHTCRSGRIPWGRDKWPFGGCGYPSNGPRSSVPLAWTGPRKRNDPLVAK